MTVAPRRIAIVPARGGSKRIPNKNIRDFCGRPMLSYIIETANRSDLFDIVHVSTDSPDIRRVAAEWGALPEFARPAELADDFTPLIPVLQWTLAEYARRGRSFDEVWLLMACAPLLLPDHLLAMARRMQELGPSSQALMAVAPFPAPVERGFRRLSDGKLEPLNAVLFQKRSQDLQVTYHDAGVVDIYRTEALLGADPRNWATLYHGHVLPRSAAVDIDSEDDWRFAEALYRGFKAL